MGRVGLACCGPAEGWAVVVPAPVCKPNLSKNPQWNRTKRNVSCQYVIILRHPRAGASDMSVCLHVHRRLEEGRLGWRCSDAFQRCRQCNLLVGSVGQNSIVHRRQTCCSPAHRLPCTQAAHAWRFSDCESNVQSETQDVMSSQQITRTIKVSQNRLVRWRTSTKPQAHK